MVTNDKLLAIIGEKDIVICILPNPILYKKEKRIISVKYTILIKLGLLK